MVFLRILAVLFLLVNVSLAATDNGDGTRTFTVGSGDFATLATVIYGHPVGVTPGDTLSGQGTTFDEDMTVNGEGLSGSPITITRIRANSFTSANAYVKLAYVIATSGTSCITISGASNEVYNATIVSCTNGVTHSVNTTIKNSIFSDTTTDIETTGGTATVSNNIAHTTDAKFVSSIDYRLRPGSPAINAGTDVGLTTDFLGKSIRGVPDIGAYEFQNIGAYEFQRAGSVSLANIRLSLVNGTAFVDFSAAATLTPYLNGKLTLTDSAGKKAIGYIKAAGTGETYGNELVTNGDMSEATGWTGTGWEIGSGIATATATSNFLYRTLSNTPGQLLKWSFNLLSRTAGSTGFRRHNVGTVALQTVPAIYTGYKVDTSAGVSVGVDALAFSGTVDDISCKAVTSPSPTGVTIVSTRGGTTYNWASIETGFNYNDASGYTYSIVPRFVGGGLGMGIIY